MKTWLNSSGLALIALSAWCLSAWLRYWDFDPPELNQWGFGSDLGTYWDLSGNILAGRGFVDSPGMGHAFSWYSNDDFAPNVVRLPVYPLTLAGMRLFWNSPEVGYLLNVISFVLILFYAYRLVELLGMRPRLIILYVLLLAFSPVYLVYLQGIQSDIFSGALVVGFAYHLFKMNVRDEHPAYRHAGFSAVYGAAAVLSRPNCLVFVLSLLLLEWVFVLQKSHRVRLSLVGLVVFVAIAGWSFRNYQVASHFKLTNLLGNNLFLNYVYYHSPPGSEFWPWRVQARSNFMVDMIRQGFSPAYAEFELDRQLQLKVIRFAIQNKGLVLRTAVRAVVGLFVDSYFDVADILVAKIFNVPLVDNHVVQHPAVEVPLHIFRKISKGYRVALLAAFIFLPVISTLKKNWHDRPMYLWISCFLFILATGLILNAGDRLLLPVFPFLVLFLVQVLDYSFERGRGFWQAMRHIDLRKRWTL